jgi:serine-type D-Ala-D-Ala carboxypeptidase/endopeptidase (penicillin-binding protein 4)
MNSEKLDLQRSDSPFPSENLANRDSGFSPTATLYAENAEQYFIPASNAKLLTMAAVLTQLGPQFRIRTSVYQLVDPNQTDAQNSVVLQVVGRGDPSLTEQQLGQLAQQIRDRGITRIHQLILDDHYFQGDPINPTWEWEDIQAGYGASVTSLMVNQNAIGLTLAPQTLGEPLQVIWDDPGAGQHWQINNYSQTVATNAPEWLQVGRAIDPITGQLVLQVAGQLRVGSAPEPVAVSIPQPVVYFGEQFQQQLLARGIQVDQLRVAPQPLVDRETMAREIAAIDSAPLAELLVEVNQESNNLYAEALLRSLKNQSSTPHSSLEAGLEAVKITLTNMGIDPDSYILVDGSGLSRRNLVSPEAIVQTLQSMAQLPNETTYRNSLSVAGISGTLRNRFQDSQITGRLQGKTGYLSSAVALSGYLQPPNYSPLAFSILLNAFELPLNQVRQSIDDIVETLANLEHC